MRRYDENAAMKGSAGMILFENSMLTLNPDYTFDTFVISDCNRSAADAVITATENLSTPVNNPLYICGAAGMGKTHLIQAVVHRLCETCPETRIVYWNTEKLCDEMIPALTQDHFAEFCSEVCQADIFLLEDIHFLLGRKTTQAYLTTICNELLVRGKQIIMTGEMHFDPQDGPMMNLIRKGKAISIQTPDTNFVQSLTRKMAVRKSVGVSKNAIDAITKNIFTNVASLKGCITRLFAFSELNHEMVSEALLEKIVHEGYFINPRNNRERLIEINQEAARFYHDCLFNQGGKEALNYLKRHQVSDHTIEELYIGAAPDGEDALSVYLLKKGYTPDELLLSGVAKEENDCNSGFQDIFRHSVMFPVFDLPDDFRQTQHIIGFTSRALGDQGPVYRHSPESPVFSKKSILFGMKGLSRDDLWLEDDPVLVEGVMDVIALYQNGITAYATFGNLISKTQIKLLRRRNRTVYLGFGADDADDHMIQQTKDRLKKQAIRIAKLSFPAGMNAEAYIREYGAVKFMKMMKQASRWAMI